jgi:hypothetical protein
MTSRPPSTMTLKPVSGGNQERDNSRAEAAAVHSEHGDHEQERRHHEVLKEQDGENRAARRGSEPFGFGKHGNHDGRGRQGKRKTEHRRRGWRLPQGQGQGAKRGGGAEDLQSA